jgi:membrane-bound metal-dependent hydrolase YbcI (DUF457 family)
MFNSTHTLVGFALGRAGFDRWSRRAVWTSVIASNLPDIDSIAGLFGTPAYLAYHRGITHSLVAMPFLAVGLAAAMYRFTGNLVRTSVVAFTALLSHLLLDYLNVYGVRPFLPFDATKFYGDTLFIIDPVFDFILLVTLICGGYFLVRRRQQCAVFGLLLATVYVGGRMELRNLCRSYLPAVRNAAVSPLPLTLFRWTAFVDNPEDVAILSIHPFRGIEGKPLVLGKDPENEVTRRAAATVSAKALMEFARFPVINFKLEDSMYRVTFFDARYYNGTSAPAAKVWLDSSLNVIDESVRFRQALD